MSTNIEEYEIAQLASVCTALQGYTPTYMHTHKNAVLPLSTLHLISNIYAVVGRRERDKKGEKE